MTTHQVKKTVEHLYLLQVIKTIFIDRDVPLEAAVLWHFYIHGADVVLAFFVTFPPQGAKPTK